MAKATVPTRAAPARPANRNETSRTNPNAKVCVEIVHSVGTCQNHIAPTPPIHPIVAMVLRADPLSFGLNQFCMRLVGKLNNRHNGTTSSINRC